MCFATALQRICWNAAPISARPGLLGHAKLDATARYTRVATGMIASIESPLDLLSQPRKKPKVNRKDRPSA